MRLKDFLFSYLTIIDLFLYEKKYFKAIRKTLGYPYKYFLELIKNFFLIKKIDLDSKDFTNLNNLPLDDLFIFFNSDKGSKVNWGGKVIKGHNYSHLYEKYFLKIRTKKNLKILEIGSLIGSSAASFIKYFDDAKVYCLDVNPFQIKYRSKDIRKLFINTRYKNTIKRVSDFFDFQFDIIIDDGSHNKRDQILTLNYFLPKLKKKGIYVIEDTCEYLRIADLNEDKLDYGVNEFVKSVFETGSHISEFLNDIEKQQIKRLINKVYLEKGNFIHNNQSLNEIIFIEKK